MEVGSKVNEVEERRGKDWGAMSYLRRNLDWIENIPEVKGYGSGPVEKTVDIMAARGFKKRGMSWYRRNANPLLELRLLELDGEWDAYWQQRLNESARLGA